MFECTFCIKKYIKHPIQIMYSGLKQQQRYSVGSDLCPHVLTAMDKELILVLSNPVFVYLTHRNYIILSPMFCSIVGGPLLTLGILNQTILNIYYPGNSIRLL